MDKNEILEKSRNEKKDEGVRNAENSGLRMGYIVFCILYMLLSWFTLQNGRSETINALSALFWCFFAAREFADYRFSKNIVTLITAILCTITTVINIVTYVMKCLG